MAKKFRFLLLDADVLIELWRRGVWKFFLTLCDVTIVATVREEARFYEDADGNRHDIDLGPGIAAGDVKVVDVPLADVQKLMAEIPFAWHPHMNPGETASLAWLLGQPAEPAWRICSGDHITFRILGMKRRSEAGISLEEIFASIGRAQGKLAKQFTKQYREDVSRQGFADGIMGR